MNITGRSLRFWLVVALAVVSAIFVIDRYQSVYRAAPLPDEARRKRLDDLIGHVPPASKVRFEKIPARERAHLLDGFRDEVYKTKLLPKPIQELYGVGQFGISSGMANPDEEFQITDVIDKNLPRRRLVFAASRASDHHWMIEFEYGGRAHGEILHVVEVVENHVSPIGACYLDQPSTNLAALSAALRHGDCSMWLYDFYDPDKATKPQKE